MLCILNGLQISYFSLWFIFLFPFTVLLMKKFLNFNAVGFIFPFLCGLYLFCVSHSEIVNPCVVCRIAALQNVHVQISKNCEYMFNGKGELRLHMELRLLIN